MKKGINKIKLKAPAKINLSLDIDGVRSDGFHEVAMIMQSIDLCDKLTIYKRKCPGVKLQVSGADLPENEDNLAYRAAELILDRAGKQSGVKIDLKKKIPVAAGLAGGSSDAAAVLKGINHLYSLDFDYEDLQKMAAVLGSDTVFCLQGGTALAKGRGEVITQLVDIPRQHLLLVNPDFEVSTARIYQQFDLLKPEKHIPTSRLVDFINSGSNIGGDEGWDNVLEPVTVALFPDIEDIKKKLNDYKTKMCMMSGSGPTVFALLENDIQGKKIIKNWPREKDTLILTTTRRADKNRIFK